MSLFRVTVVDKKGHIQIKEVHSNNVCGAKQQVLVQLGEVYSGLSHRNQDKSVVIRSVEKIA